MLKIRSESLGPVAFTRGLTPTEPPTYCRTHGTSIRPHGAPYSPARSHNLHIRRRLAPSSAPTTAISFSPTPVDKFGYPFQLKFTSLWFEVICPRGPSSPCAEWCQMSFVARIVVHLPRRHPRLARLGQGAPRVVSWQGCHVPHRGRGDHRVDGWQAPLHAASCREGVCVAQAQDPRPPGPWINPARRRRALAHGTAAEFDRRETVL